jgi:hypothetical protein
MTPLRVSIESRSPENTNRPAELDVGSSVDVVTSASNPTPATPYAARRRAPSWRAMKALILS